VTPTRGTLLRNHGVTAPAGFKASAVNGSVAVLVNEGPDLGAAGVFTDDDPGGAALWTRQVLGTARLRAVLVHPASPGTSLSEEFGDTHRAAEQVADTLSGWGTSTGAGEVAVCTIGGCTPPALLDVVADAVHEIGGGLGGGSEAARLLAGQHGNTRQAALQHADGWTVGAMATDDGTLGVLSTDAVADAATLLSALNGAEPASSTVLLLASGASETPCSPAELGASVSSLLADLRAQREY
jgi:glutamate N-acetyltransferase/amino-acid N-acetyltransferase